MDRDGRIDDTCHEGLLVGKRVMVSLQRDHFGTGVCYLSARCAIRGIYWVLDRQLIDKPEEREHRRLCRSSHSFLAGPQFFLIQESRGVQTLMTRASRGEVIGEEPGAHEELSRLSRQNGCQQSLPGCLVRHADLPGASATRDSLLPGDPYAAFV